MNSSDFMYYRQPSGTWTDALPIGNGRLGAMVFGGISEERLALNEDTLWSGYPRQTNLLGAAEHWRRAKELVMEGETAEAQRLIEQKWQSEWSQAYMPMGDLRISMIHETETTDYMRSLDLSTAISTVSYKEGNVNFLREYLASAPDNGIVMKLVADKAGAITFTAWIETKLKSEISFSENGSSILWQGECPGIAVPVYVEVEAEERIKYSEKPEERGIRFQTILSIETVGGSVSHNEGKLFVVGADSAVIRITSASSFNGYNKNPFTDGKEYLQASMDMMEQLNKRSFEEVKADHIKDYQSLYNRISFTLEEDEPVELPTDDRLFSFADHGVDKGLYLLLFNFGRYLLISSSRKGSQPTNLQGIWNDSISPPWSSNYTININTEMNYWPVLPCNLPELQEPLNKMVSELAQKGRETAKIHYGSEGFVSHHNTDIWRMTNPVGKSRDPGSAVYACWAGSSGWLARHLYEYYEYTLDETFLREQAYPVMREAMRFYLDELVEDVDGGLIFCPATSPENTYYLDAKRTALSKSATMMTGIIIDLLQNMREAVKVLGIEDDVCDTASQLAPRLKAFSVGTRGQLVEWYDEYEEAEPLHRHVSHLYSLYPARVINEKTPALFNACKKTLELRGDDGTGWSLGWKINLWARLKDGNHALKLITRQLRVVTTTTTNMQQGGGTYINMFDAHPPFQIDGNFGAVAGITELLLQCPSMGELEILPALPEEWHTGEIKGLAAKGGIIVDIAWKDCKAVSVRLNPKKTGSVVVCVNGLLKQVDLKEGQAVELLNN